MGNAGQPVKYKKYTGESRNCQGKRYNELATLERVCYDRRKHNTLCLRLIFLGSRHKWKVCAMCRNEVRMNLVITMSRRYGTGASMIAGELSEKLGIPVYDKAYIENELHDNSYSGEAEVIKELAQNSCIILGRCASEILKDQGNVFNIYVCADKEDRIARIMKKENLSHEDAKEMLEKNDRDRADYYYEHTGKVWGDVNNYHMILDTSKLGAENCADILMRYFERVEII